jgi:WhiB family redox-sensing transcriptional regulator
MASTGDGRVDVIVGAADHGDRDGYDRNTGAGQIGRPGLFAGLDTFELLEALCDNDEAEDWQDRALCAETDPESFFPEKGGSTREAKRICSGCEVRAECLEYALAHDERFGIWGGLSERERRKLKREAS